MNCIYTNFVEISRLQKIALTDELMKIKRCHLKKIYSIIFNPYLFQFKLRLFINVSQQPYSPEYVFMLKLF